MGKFAVSCFGLQRINFGEFLGFEQIVIGLYVYFVLGYGLIRAIKVSKIGAETQVCESIRMLEFAEEICYWVKTFWDQWKSKLIVLGVMLQQDKLWAKILLQIRTYLNQFWHFWTCPNLGGNTDCHQFLFATVIDVVTQDARKGHLMKFFMQTWFLWAILCKVFKENLQIGIH